MDLSQRKQLAAVEKELRLVEKQEEAWKRGAEKRRQPGWREQLEQKLPEKVCDGLQSAFCKGFSLVFLQGRSVLEKSYDKEELRKDHSIRDYAVRLKGGRRELRQMRQSAKRSDLRNLALTTAEGLGLGALGIGLPDIVLFVGTLLKGIYETALRYGFSYESAYEQMFILKLMAAAMSGEDRARGDAQAEAWLAGGEREVDPALLQEQLRSTASIFAMDMLLLKFIQGFPVVGILGGAANPLYYRKVMAYVQLKYRKRYLLRLKAEQRPHLE